MNYNSFFVIPAIMFCIPHLQYVFLNWKKYWGKIKSKHFYFRVLALIICNILICGQTTIPFNNWYLDCFNLSENT